MPSMTELPTPRTFEAAEEALLPYTIRRKIANNTLLHRDRSTGDMYVVLHGTEIVRWTRDGVVIFKTGGHVSATTRNRLNSYAPEGTYFTISDRVLYFAHRDGSRPRVRVSEGMRYLPASRRVQHVTVRPLAEAPAPLASNPCPTVVIDNIADLNTYLSQFVTAGTRGARSGR